VADPTSTLPPPWPPDAAVLEAIATASLAVDTDGQIAACNRAALDLLGRSVRDLVGRPLWDSVFAPTAKGGVDEVLAQVLGGTPWSGELPAVTRTGATSDAVVSIAPVGAPPVGVLVMVEDVSSSGARARRLADRLARLAHVNAELLFAETVDAVTKIVIDHLVDAAGATVGSLSLVAGDELVLMGLRGAREGASNRWATYPLASNTPAAEAVRVGSAIVLSGRDEISSRYPDLERAAEGERSMVCLPLRIGTRPIGVVTMSYPGRRSFDPPELEFFHLLADTCAQALDRLQARHEATRESSKLQFLLDASAELSSSLDYEATLRRVAELAVPRYADWCAISLLEDGILHIVAVSHPDADKLSLAEEYQRRYPADPTSQRGAYGVLRTGRSELTPEITDRMLADAVPDAEQLAILRQLDFAIALLVPLRAKDRVLGVLTWVRGSNGTRFGPSDVAFAEELGRRAGVAIENAQLHSELRDVASRLQSAVLPPPLPDIDGWLLAAHYRTAGHTDVGGDFYDVVPLDDTSLALFVGDVMGRGVQAATAMAQMRAAVRAFIAVDPRPRSMLTRLDRLFGRYEFEQLVTMVYAVVDTAAETMTVANAGHPTPLIVRAGGAVEQVGPHGDLLLGAGGAERSTLTAPFGLGETLLVFTDGLIERHTEDIDTGEDRLIQHARGLATGDLQTTLDAIVATVRDPTRDDDVAAVALRRIAP
jgi:PAS domain S-box-containing protein